jgi:hypothetical protein
MEDIKRLWHGLLGIIHGIFAFVDYFATRSPTALGFVLLALAIAITVYSNRRYFYGTGLSSGWDEPRYGNVVKWQSIDFALNLAIALCAFFGVMVLFRKFLPVLFEDIAEFVLRITG